MRQFDWETRHVSEPRDYDWTEDDMVDAHLEMNYEDRYLSNDDEYRSWYYEGTFWDDDDEEDDWDDEDEDFTALTDDEE